MFDTSNNIKLPKNFVDITGRRFGKLTALEYIGNGDWKCLCDCGNTKIIYGVELRRGMKSCGCLKNKPKTDITNQHFGKLTAVKYIGKSNWECLCDCGNTTIATTYNLTHGVRISCGCLNKERARQKQQQMAKERIKMRIGERFGRLTIIDRIDNKFLCRCDCGNICSVGCSNITSGTTRSCGCLRSERNRRDILKVSSYNPRFQIREKYKEIFGEVTDDMSVIALDGNILNHNTENLMAVNKLTYHNLLKNNLLGLGETTRSAALVYELERRVRECNK